MKKKFKIFLPILTFLVLFFVVFRLEIFKAKNIEVKILGADCVDKSFVKELISKKINNTLFYESNFLNQTIKQKFLCVQEVVIRRVLPSKLDVDLRGRKAEAIVNSISFPPHFNDLGINEESASSQVANLQQNLGINLDQATSSGKFLVDRSGFIFSEFKNGNLNLPEITLGLYDITLGKTLPDNLIDLTLLVNDEVKRLEIPIEHIIVLDKKLILGSSPRLIFSLDKATSSQIASLQLILQKARIESRPIESIDLRFDKPVVVYAPRKA